MEQLLESYHGKGDKSRVLKLISYGEGPIKKVLKKYEKDEEIELVLKEAKNEFSRIFDSIPTMEKGQNRNVLAAGYSVALYKVLKKRGYSQTEVEHIFYNAIDTGITMVPLFMVRGFLDSVTFKTLKDIKRNGARNTIEKLNYEIVDDRIKVKKDVITNIVRTENVREAMPYMKAFILLS